MAVTVVLNGVTYSIPEPGDTAWGQNLTDYFVAQASGLLQKAGGNFTLTADVNFGSTFGLLSKYFKSRSSNPAASGVVRLASTEALSWRNNANSADIALSKNSSDQLTYGGAALFSSSGVLLASIGSATGISLTLSSSLIVGATSSAPYVATGRGFFVADGSVGSVVMAAYNAGNPTPSFRGYSARGTAASPTASQADDTLVALIAHGYGATSFSSANKGGFEVRAAENWTDAAQGTYLPFFTTQIGGTTRSEKMRLTDSGKLGIGMTPIKTLDVTGDVGVSGTTTSSAYIGTDTTQSTSSTTGAAIFAGGMGIAKAVNIGGVLGVGGAVVGSSTFSGTQYTSTIATGTAPLVVASTTRVANLNVATAGTADTVTTNANLTGVITSVGNATSIASQTGTGTKFVVDTSPTLVTPVLGVAAATSINKVAITAPATSATLTIADGKTLTANRSLTLTGTDSTTMTFPGTSATIARTDAGQTFTGVQVFSSAPTMSALTVSQAVFTDGSKNLISNAITGSGNVVMSASPTLTGTITAAAITASGAVSAGGQLTVSGGTSASGASVNGVATGLLSGATQTTIANNGTATFAFGANASGLLMIYNSSTGENPYLLLAGGGGTFQEVVANAGFSTTLTTSGKTNLQYTTAGTGTITVENKKGSSQNYVIIFIRTV